MEPKQSAKPTPSPADLVDATRRTYLAGERTQLAWWRTGLTALAVALGVGRVIPELDSGATGWPYVVTGIGFALWGIVAIAYGARRRTALERSLAEGRFLDSGAGPLRGLAFAGAGLGLLTVLLIAFG